VNNPMISAGLNPAAIGLAQHYGQQSHWPYPQTGQIGSPFGQIGSPFGQIGSPFGQIGSPFGQIGSPFGQIGYPLAPQSWIGQGLGPVHGIQSQLIPRPFQAQGLSPWGY